MSRFLAYFDENKPLLRVVLYEHEVPQAKWERYRTTRYRGMVERVIVTAKPPRQSRQHYWYVMPRRSRAVDDLRSDRRTPAGEPEGKHPAPC